MSAYALVQDGEVINIIEWDGVPFTPAEGDDPARGWSPPQGTVAVAIQDGLPVAIGYSFDGTLFVAPPQPGRSTSDILTENTAARDQMLAAATLAVAPLQDAVDLDEATDAEIALLKQWKQYRIAVNRVDLTQEDPVWPNHP